MACGLAVLDRHTPIFEMMENPEIRFCWCVGVQDERFGPVQFRMDGAGVVPPFKRASSEVDEPSASYINISRSMAGGNNGWRRWLLRRGSDRADRSKRDRWIGSCLRRFSVSFHGGHDAERGVIRTSLTW